MNSGVGIGFGLVTSLLLAALAASGLDKAAVLIAVGITLFCAALIIINHTAIDSQERNRRDDLSLGMAATFVAAPVLASYLISPPTADRTWPIRALIVALTLSAASVYVSNLIDWAYTRPHLNGAGSLPRPCSISTDARLRTVTQVLLGQRLVTYALVRLGLAAAAAFLAVATLPHLSSTVTSALVAAITLVTGYYLNRVIPMASLVTYLPVVIGDVVVLADESAGAPEERPAYYVAMIVFEGIHLIELDEHGKPRNDRPRDGPDRLVDLAEAKQLLRRRQPFTGCAKTCSKANSFCPLVWGDPL